MVPFGGGTSVVGGVEPLRGGHGGRGLARPRADRPRRRGGHALADRRAGSGPARARRRARARPPRAHAGPLPAVLGVRDARRLGRHPLGRPGLDRVRQHRQAGRRAALRRTGGRDRPRRRAGHRRRPGPAPAAGRLRGRAGCDHRGHGAGPAAARRDPLRGLDVPRVRAGRGGVPGARAGTRDPGRRAALRRGRDAPGADPLGGRLAAPGGSGRAYIGARRYAERCLAILGFEGTRQDVDGAPRARAAHHAARRRTGAGRRARTCLAAQPLRGPVPARRAARPRHHGRDARDGGALVEPAWASTRSVARAIAGALEHAARPGA